MKKILATLFVCIPAFAMDPQSYEDRLTNLETTVTKIDKVLFDSTSIGNQGIMISEGLETKVQNIQKILNDEKDKQGKVISEGLETRVQNIQKILDDEKDKQGKVISEGLETKVQNIQKILNDEKDEQGTIISDGLETMVQNIQKILNGEKDEQGTIISEGLITNVKDIQKILNDEKDEQGTIISEGLETMVQNIQKILNGERDEQGAIISAGLVAKVSGLLEFQPTINYLIESIKNLNKFKNKTEYDITNIQTILNDNETGLLIRVNNIETSQNTVNSTITDIQKILNDEKDEQGTIISEGLVTKVNNNTKILNGINYSNESLSKITAENTKNIADMQLTIATLNTTFYTELEKTWRAFVEEKYQEYMNEKKKIQDIILSCKANGTPVPSYIMETAEQLQACDLNTRRSVLSNILGKLNILAPLLDGEKIESIQNYLNATNVAPLQTQKIESIMLGIELEGNYIRVSGDTRTFTQSTELKTGLPKQTWMDTKYDYFPCRSRPGIERIINEENRKRQTQNSAIEQANALALAKYQTDIQAANKVTFPANDFKSVVTDYNQKLTHHDI